MDNAIRILSSQMDDFTTEKAVILAVCFMFCLLVMPLYYVMGRVILSKRQPTGIASGDEPVHTDNVRLGEWLPHFIALCVVACIFFTTMDSLVHSLMLGVLIILFVIVALQLRHHSARQLLGVASLFLSLGCMILAGFLVLGHPQKAPEIDLGTAKLIVGNTTIKELRQDGFTLYVLKPDAQSFNAVKESQEDITTAADYQAYDPAQGTMLPKLHGNSTLSDERPPYTHIPYVLVKDGRIWGNVELFGSSTDATPLDDCVITEYAFFPEQYGANSYKDLPIKLDGCSLFDLTEAWLIDTYNKKNIHPQSEWDSSVGANENAETRARSNKDYTTYWIYNQHDDGIKIWKQYKIDLTVHNADTDIKRLDVRCMADRYLYIGTYRTN